MFRDHAYYMEQMLYDFLGQEPELYSKHGDRMHALVGNATMSFNHEREQAEYTMFVAGTKWIIARPYDLVWRIYEPDGTFHEIGTGKLWLFMERLIKFYKQQQRAQQRQRSKQQATPSVPKAVQTAMDLDLE
ncbi:hypothetical protein [Herpetosiphon sp. NSE202]|uniref:hypothetical protein n=1 Tax=Herpetosiphon sp. NSE202 TaxID=3351349 RepID=UPI00362C2082